MRAAMIVKKLPVAGSGVPGLSQKFYEKNPVSTGEIFWERKHTQRIISQ